MRRRGSTTIVLVSMLASTAVLLLTVITMASRAIERQARLEREYQARMAFEAVVTDVVDMTTRRVLSLPYSTTTTVGGYTVKADVALDPTVQRALLITGEVRGRDAKYRFERLVGDRKLTTPFSFALYSNSNLDVKTTLASGTTSVSGDVYARGNLSFTSGPSYVYGAIAAKGSLALNGTVATQGTRTGATDIGMPSVVSALYLALPGEHVSGTSRNGYTFAQANDVFTVSGDLRFKGTISGRGLILVTGDLAFDGNTSYATTDSKVVFVCLGDVTITSAVNSLVGSIYAADALETDLLTMPTTIYGSIAAGRFTGDDIAKPITIQYDPFLTDEAVAKALHVPGYWP